MTAALRALLGADLHRGLELLAAAQLATLGLALTVLAYTAWSHE
ncbi:hypothetical protein [Kitasatospora mediocidica]|nr:hypothetical protein [Kitasatospora mediocidica]